MLNDMADVRVSPIPFGEFFARRAWAPRDPPFDTPRARPL